MNIKDFKDFAKNNSELLLFCIEELKQTKTTQKQKDLINSLEIHLENYKILSQSIDN